MNYKNSPGTYIHHNSCTRYRRDNFVSYFRFFLGKHASNAVEVRKVNSATVTADIRFCTLSS